MARQYLYAGESDGGRIIKFGGSALTQITTAGTTSVLLSGTTLDWEPTGPAGDNVFRAVVLSITYTNGYSVRVTPSVDGTALAAQDFSGSGAGKRDLKAFVSERGSRISVVWEQLTRTGDLTVQDIQVAYIPIRQFP